MGKTHGRTPPGTAPTVHPHVRGEDEADPHLKAAFSGSPPRTWGRRTRTTRSGSMISVHPHVRGEDGAGEGPPGLAERFTPTYVGKTRAQQGALTRSSVHPHVRGEDGRRSFSHFIPSGSPPRTWGRPAIETAGGESERFTPTYVGKTGRRGELLPTCLVHPHVRGEDWNSNPAVT